MTRALPWYPLNFFSVGFLHLYSSFRKSLLQSSPRAGVRRPEVCATIHIPCRRRGASASRQRTLCSTRSVWHATLSLTPWRDHCNTHRSSLTLVAVFAGARARHHSENGLAGPSRSPGAPHAPRLPPSQRGPHLSCPCGAHHGLIWSPSRRQGGAVEEPQSDAMEVDSTMEARPHAYRPCARHRPRRCSRGCSALWNLLTLVLCRA